MTCATGHPPRPSGSKRRPLPDWATYQPNSIWIRRLHPLPSPTRRPTSRSASPFEQALEAEDLLTSALERADALKRQPVLDGDDDPDSAAAGRLGQRGSDDRHQHPPVHGHGRHHSALRAPGDPHRPGLDQVTGRNAQDRVTPPTGHHRPRRTQDRARLGPCRVQQPAPAPRASATSPLSTSTKDADPPSAKPTRTSWNKPPDNDSPTTDNNDITKPTQKTTTMSDPTT